MKPLVLAALFLSTVAFAAPAQEKHLTLFFTGDNGGEVAPCG
ncbi:MAG: hypothetical protein ACJ790_21160 [Myxococcaceae bacterium]